MLDKRTSADGLVYLVSPALSELGVPHAFATRQGREAAGAVGGGAGEGAVAGAGADKTFGNNPENPKPASEAEIEANYQLLSGAAGLAGRKRATVWQVHGNEVLLTQDVADLSGKTQADGLVSRDAVLYLSVRGADCATVLLSDAAGSVVSAVHAGWRGVANGVIKVAARKLMDQGAKGKLTGAIGPCIGTEAFEVGPEVLKVFLAMPEAAGAVIVRADGKGHVDLRTILLRQMRACGVEKVDVAAGCTVAQSALYHSHRRDGVTAGRQVAVIGVRAG